MSGFDIQRLFANAPLAFGGQPLANPFANQQGGMPAYVMPMANNYGAGDMIQVQSFLENPSVPMPTTQGQQVFPMPIMQGNPTVPMPTVPGQATIPMPTTYTGQPTNVVQMPGYPAPGVPQPNNFPNPWASVNSVYGIPISGSVAQTMNETNQMMQKAAQIRDEGMAAAAQAQARTAAEGTASQGTESTSAGTEPKIERTADGKILAPDLSHETEKLTEIPTEVVDRETGELRPINAAEKKWFEEQMKKQDAAEKTAHPTVETIAEERKEASVKALAILSALGHDGKVQDSDFAAALKSPEAANNPEVKEAIEFIKEHSKTLAGTRGDENEHVTYEELGFIQTKLENGSWKSLDQALDYGAERKLFKLIMKNNEEEDGFTWGFADSNLELDGKDYDELVKAIGDDEKTKEKLDELKSKFEDFKRTAGVGNNQGNFFGAGTAPWKEENDNWWNWTDGNEMTKEFCEDMFKAIDNGWSMQQVLDKKNLDDLLKSKPANWDAPPKKEGETEKAKPEEEAPSGDAAH